MKTDKKSEGENFALSTQTQEGSGFAETMQILPYVGTEEKLKRLAIMNSKVERFQKVGNKLAEIERLKNEDDGSTIEMHFERNGQRVMILNQAIVRNYLNACVEDCVKIFNQEEEEMLALVV
jgi:hypothetical protein